MPPKPLELLETAPPVVATTAPSKRPSTFWDGGHRRRNRSVNHRTVGSSFAWGAKISKAAFGRPFLCASTTVPQLAPSTNLVARTCGRSARSRLGPPLTPATVHASSGYPNSRTLRATRGFCFTAADGEGQPGCQRRLVCRHCGCMQVLPRLHTSPIWGRSDRASFLSLGRAVMVRSAQIG